ncbi:MAG: TonB-dependent receptor [Bacteroidales bacterium]
MSVIYGSNALAGAINIITKENRFTSFSSTLNSYVETRGTYNFDGRVAVKRGRHSMSLSGARNFFGGYSLDSLRSQHWKPKEQYNADLYYIYSRDDLRLKYQTSLMNERLWSKGDLIPPFYFKAIDDWFYSMRYNNRLEMEKKIGQAYNLNLLASHSLYTRLRKTVSKDFSDLSETEIDRDYTGFNAFNFRVLFGNQDPAKRFSFISGLDLNYEIGEGERILDGRQEMGDYALFGIMMINPSPKVSLQPGFRFAINTRFPVPPVPSVNLKWEILPRVNMRASYARGYRAPTLKELYIFFVDINHNIQPNEELNAEYGNNFDLNFTFNTDRSEKTHMTKVDANLFYNKMNNIIVLAEIDQQEILYQYVNIQNYNTLGGKVTFKYSYYPIFDIEFGLGTTGTYFSLGEEKQSFDEYMFSPDANVNISGTIPLIDLRLSVYYKFTGDSYFFRLDENDQVDVSIMDNYHNMDITLIRKFMANRLSISAGVKNIFDNTLIRTSGNTGGEVHSSAGGSLVGYGRVWFLKAGYNVFR